MCTAGRMVKWRGPQPRAKSQCADSLRSQTAPARKHAHTSVVAKRECACVCARVCARVCVCVSVRVYGRRSVARVRACARMWKVSPTGVGPGLSKPRRDVLATRRWRSCLKRGSNHNPVAREIAGSKQITLAPRAGWRRRRRVRRRPPPPPLPPPTRAPASPLVSTPTQTNTRTRTHHAIVAGADQFCPTPAAWRPIHLCFPRESLDHNAGVR